MFRARRFWHAGRAAHDPISPASRRRLPCAAAAALRCFHGAGDDVPGTPRHDATVRLAREVFSRGSESWKKVDALRYLPDGNDSYPEIALVGEAGSGRTTLVRALTQSTMYGRIGQRGTGLTNRLDFYNVGECFMLVDTPGFGHWFNVSHGRTRADASMMQALTMQYLALRKHANLQHVYWTIPANKPELTPCDRFLATFLAKEQIPYTIVVTKMDQALKAGSHKSHRNFKRASNPETMSGADADDPFLQQIPLPGSALKRRDRLHQRTFNDIHTRLTTLLRPFLADDGTGTGTAEPTVPMLDVAVKARMGHNRRDITGAKTRAPAWRITEMHNVGALAVDMVRHVTKDVEDPSKLTIDTMKRISFAPATAAFQIAVEDAYTVPVAEQIYDAHARYVHLQVMGEPVPYSLKAALGEVPGGAITANTVDGNLALDAHRVAPQLQQQLAIAGGGDQQIAGAGRQHHPQQLDGDVQHHHAAGWRGDAMEAAPSGGATVTRVEPPQPPSAAAPGDMAYLQSNATAALTAMVGHRLALEPEPPQDASPRSLNAYLAASLEHQAASRGDLATPEPTYVGSLSGRTQMELVARSQSKDRFEAAVETPWMQTLHDEEPFEDTSVAPRGREQNLIRRAKIKYAEMTHRKERAWRTDAAATLNPFGALGERHAVQGAPTADRASGAGYRMDGLRQKNLFGVTKKTGKSQAHAKLHRWARPVTKGVQ